MVKTQGQIKCEIARLEKILEDQIWYTQSTNNLEIQIKTLNWVLGGD